MRLYVSELTVILGDSNHLHDPFIKLRAYVVQVISASLACVHLKVAQLVPKPTP